MGDPAIERQARVIAVVDPVPGIVRVGGSRADLDIRAEAGAAVGAERPPELRVIVHDPVGVARAAGTEVVAAVVPDDGEVAGGGVERDLRQELAVGGGVVVHPHRRAPGGPVVVGVPHVDVRVVALVRLLGRVDHVHPPGMRAAGPVPGQAHLGVDRAIRLRGDEVEPADVGLSDEDAAPESGRAEPVRIYVHEDLAPALPGLSQAAGLHHLAGRADRNVAVGTVVGPGHHLDRDEGADLTESGDRGAGGGHRAARVEHHPDLVVRRRDGGLVDETEQPAVIPARLLARQAGLGDVGDHMEGEPAVGAERDRDLILHLVQVRHEQVPVAVEGQARVAASIAERVTGAQGDQLPGPRLAAVEADALEHPGRQPGLGMAHVGHRHDVAGVDRVDGDRLFGLVQMPLADIDVDRRRGRGLQPGPGRSQPGRGARHPDGCQHGNYHYREPEAAHVQSFP